jgi:hypothetical protein
MVTLRQQRPSDPCGLIGLGDAGTMLPTPGFDPLEPATPGIRFAIDDPQHRAGTMDEEGAEVAIPALRHPEKGCLSPRRMLPGDEPQPGGKLTAILKVGRIAHRCYQCGGGQGANPGQLRQPLTGLVGCK